MNYETKQATIYKVGEIVKDCYGQKVIVVNETNTKTKLTTVQKHNHWSKYQYTTYLPNRKVA
jgi:hypothetical protein